MSVTIRSELLKRYGRAIVHMRQLLKGRRLGLALGSGVSQSVGLPSWPKLIEGINKALIAKNVTGPPLENESGPVQAQVLATRFRQMVEASAEILNVGASQREGLIATAWRKLLRDVLYEGVATPSEMTSNHPYAAELASLAYFVPVVVTYNFDDLLERALASSPQKPRDTVGYYSAWGPGLVVQDGRPVVYHPNGFLPFESIDRYSEQVILTEQALSDQIIDSMLGGFALLLDYYSRSPCLFLGFSLNDPAQRNILRQSTRRAPGNVHYYVRYYRDAKPTEHVQKEIAETNFDLFNMITLHLNDAEIRELLSLLAETDETDFMDACVEAGVSTRYLHYVAGPVSVGKTTVISRLQGISIVDEWLKPREPLIAKPSTDLSPDERDKVDNWIYEQVRLKNGRYVNAEPGLHVMDRAPLDAFAFPPFGEPQKKAEQIFAHACAGNSGTPQSFKRGKLILLTGRPYDLHTRQIWRGREKDEDYVRAQQEALRAIYPTEGYGCATRIDTGGLPLDVVIKQVVRAIHFEPYGEFQFAERLDAYRSGNAS